MARKKDYPIVDLAEIKAAHALYWYDRTWRSWGAAYYTASGDQFEEAVWSHFKECAILEAERIAATRRCQIGKLRAA